MEQPTASPELLESLMCPAFLVYQDNILQANQAALQLQLQTGTPVSQLITVGAEEYAHFSGGKLCLELNICQTNYSTCVTQLDHCHLFCLESDYTEPELRALALASQELREPLTNAMLNTDLLLPTPASLQDEALRSHLALINKSLHQLLRAVCNMSDTASYRSQRSLQTESRDAAGFFKELLEKSAGLCAHTNRKLHYQVPKQTLNCRMDSEKVERAVLNLISNAIRYSPEGSTIHTKLQQSGSWLLFTVENDTTAQFQSSPFARYLREPGLETGSSGIGLGLTLVRSVATAHGGVLLMEPIGAAGVRFTMTLAVAPCSSTMLRSPVFLPTDYAGGREHCLLELSDTLPDNLFDGSF